MSNITDSLTTTDSSRTKFAVKFAAIDVVAAGAQEIVAAVAGKKIRVLSMFVSCHVVTTINIQDDTGTPVELVGGTAQILLDPVSAAGMPSFTLPYNPCGWFETSAAKALDFNMTGVGGGVAGCLSYIEIA